MKYYDLVRPDTLDKTVDVLSRDYIKQDLRKYHVQRMILSPTRWSACTLDVELHWQVVKFEKSEADKIPDHEGIYTFVVQPRVANHPSTSYLLYLGKTDKQTLRQRFRQYFTEKTKAKGRPHVQDMLVDWENHLWFCFAEIGDTGKIGRLESDLLDAFVPPVNRSFPGVVNEAMRAWS